MVDGLPNDWIAQLKSVIADTIREFSPRIRGTPIILLVVDCFPWHGSIELSILTLEESVSDPALMDLNDIAAWRHYNFADKLASWQSVKLLGRQMADAYYATTNEGRHSIADVFSRECAVALASAEVVQAIQSLTCASGFQAFVPQPDDRGEFHCVQT